MTILQLRGRRPQAQAWVRDPLASDVDNRLVVRAPAEPPKSRASTRTWPVQRRVRRLPVGWPIAAAVAGWPVWWALGVTNLVFPVAAVPLVWQMTRRGRVRVPPFFWVWMLFLVLVLVSGLTIDVDMAGAATSAGSGRYFSFGFRWLNYVAVTVMLLYLGNTTEQELPRRRVIYWFSALAMSCIVLGTLSIAAPGFGFTTPASHVLPGAVMDEGSAVVKLSQLQPVLGDASPRPSAPFPFTNAWGNNLSLLLVWLVVGLGVLGGKPRRLLLYGVLALAAVPIIYSLNRGMWLGIGVALVVVAVRLGLHGRVKILAGLVLALTLGAFAFAGSPLESMVNARFETGHSNEIRASLLQTSIDAASQSPLVGFGSTRKTLGSDESIAIGPSPACPRCGARNIGSTGQLTLLLVSQGFLGVLLYAGFLVLCIGRYLRDHSALGIAGTLVVLMELVYAGFYSALTMPLAIAFLSIGLLWRNDELRRAARRQS
ncbi:O-antigen ligase family protein [Nocardioides sp. MAHUQ-72]|uniref:O-antigen ligase family protein n=1 Tax=unclassified Nocardioides TaxID=2615069 RepID=UPI00360B7FAC